MSSEPTNPDREAEKTTRETVPASAAQQSRASEWDEASESSKSSESPHQFAQAVSASMSANMRRTAPPTVTWMFCTPSAVGAAWWNHLCPRWRSWCCLP